jgi:hypothetical protein
MSRPRDKASRVSSPSDPVEGNIHPPDNLRCHCGSLLARLVPGGVELKCRRCKRTITVPLTNPEG